MRRRAGREGVETNGRGVEGEHGQWGGFPRNGADSGGNIYNTQQCLPRSCAAAAAVTAVARHKAGLRTAPAASGRGLGAQRRVHDAVHGGKVQQGGQGDEGVEDFVVAKEVGQRVGAPPRIHNRLCGGGGERMAGWANERWRVKRGGSRSQRATCQSARAHQRAGSTHYTRPRRSPVAHCTAQCAQQRHTTATAH